MKLYQPRNKAQATLLKKLFIDHEIRFHNNRLSAKEFCAEFDLTLYFLPSTGEGIGGMGWLRHRKRHGETWASSISTRIY